MPYPRRDLMNRTLLPIRSVILGLAVLVAGCSRDQGTPAARATITPPPRPSPQALASGTREAEDLYVDVEANPDEGAPPLTVKFTTSVEDAAAPITYTWDFGDGSPPSSDASPTHVYQKAGEFTATVTVKDSKGKTGSEEADVFVETD
jgi:PKD repeat protein